jgi:hypothetical protein
VIEAAGSKGRAKSWEASLEGEIGWKARGRKPEGEKGQAAKGLINLDGAEKSRSGQRNAGMHEAASGWCKASQRVWKRRVVEAAELGESLTWRFFCCSADNTQHIN